MEGSCWTGRVIGVWLRLWPTQVMKMPWPETTFYGTVTLSFVIPSEAEGSAVQRTFREMFFFDRSVA